jgi:hypothetical protein
MEDITISPQALDQRFNTESVAFLKAIFQQMLEKQNRILRNDNELLKSHFKTIKVVDSTTISLPENLKSTYRGSGGSSSDAAASKLSQGLAKTPRGNPNGVDIIDHELYQVVHLTKITKKIKKLRLDTLLFTKHPPCLRPTSLFYYLLYPVYLAFTMNLLIKNFECLIYSSFYCYYIIYCIYL